MELIFYKFPNEIRRTPTEVIYVIVPQCPQGVEFFSFLNLFHKIVVVNLLRRTVYMRLRIFKTENKVDVFVLNQGTKLLNNVAGAGFMLAMYKCNLPVWLQFRYVQDSLGVRFKGPIFFGLKIGARHVFAGCQPNSRQQGIRYEKLSNGFPETGNPHAWVWDKIEVRLSKGKQIISFTLPAAIKLDHVNVLQP